jgi:hypothetical protein
MTKDSSTKPLGAKIKLAGKIFPEEVGLQLFPEDV